MAEWQPEFPKRKGRGSYPRLCLDDRSRALIEVYRVGRRHAFEPPQENSLNTEVDALTAWRFASASLGGSQCLEEIMEDTTIASAVLREPSRSKRRRLEMHRALSRLIGFTHDGQRAAELQAAILAGLSPRRKPHAWYEISRAIGGPDTVTRRRPPLGSADLFTFIEAASGVLKKRQGTRLGHQ